MDELYKNYGELMIQAEIINAKIQAVKQAIIEEMNKSKPAEIQNASNHN
jgi:hypothetical protein